MTDPVADMLMRIRDAADAKLSRVDIPASKLKLETARILRDEGYINNFVVRGDGRRRSIRIFPRVDAQGVALIDQLARASDPDNAPSRIRRKSNAPDLLYPKQPSVLGKERIEAAVKLTIFQTRALQNKRKVKRFARHPKGFASQAEPVAVEAE
ncbi:MAG TPA: 30S ribosomal protein S8 [Pyrinomonadaceae bacterium]